MYRYMIYSVVLLAFSGFIERYNGSVLATDDPLKGIPPSMSLSSSVSIAGSKHGLDNEEKQRKRLKTDLNSSSNVEAHIQEDGDEENEEEARSFVALAGEQVFANPIFDVTAKYLLADDEIRLGFMRTFTQNPNIVSTKLLDSSLNPLRSLTQARAFLGDEKNTDFMDRIRKKKDTDSIKVIVQEEGDEEEEVLKNGDNFLLELSKVFNDLKKQFPPLERNSQLDVVCELNNGEFILVEVQVKPQDFWDKRALCYAAAFYGNQLKRGGDWRDLKKVIAINLLGGEGKHWRNTPMELVRHYKFVSIVGGHNHEIDSLQLVQYNLLSPQIDGLTQVELREWLQFWKAAHQRKPEEISGITTESVKNAYNRIRVATLPAEVRAGYETEVSDYLRYSQYIHAVEGEAHGKGVEEGESKAMLAVAIKMFRKNDAYTPDIMDFTGVTETQIREALAKEKDK